MSKGNVQEVMDHNSLPLEFYLPDGKDAQQTAQKCYQLKINHLANVIYSIHVVYSAIYIMNEIPFCFCNFDIGKSHTPIFFLKALCTRLLILDFNRSCGIEV